MHDEFSNDFIAEISESKKTMKYSGNLARVLRKKLGITLDQLSKKIGVSKSHLSRYERGEKDLSITTFIRLSKALNIPIEKLIKKDENYDLLHVIRFEDRVRYEINDNGSAYSFSPLTQTNKLSLANVFTVYLNDESNFTKDVHHEGEELFYVLSGIVEISIGSRLIELYKDDFIQFSASIRHKVRAKSQDASLLIFVISNQEPKKL